MLNYGLVRGRHPLPVDSYIFDEVADVLDFASMRAVVEEFVAGISAGSEIEVYVTGLTACTAEVIRSCALHGVGLTLYHFDRDSGGYVPQRLF